MSLANLSLGTTPSEEPSPLGEPDLAKANAKRLIKQLKRQLVKLVSEFDPEPHTSVKITLADEKISDEEKGDLILGYYELSFKVRLNPGNYYTVELTYNDNNEKSMAMAMNVDNFFPTHWSPDETKETSDSIANASGGI